LTLRSWVRKLQKFTVLAFLGFALVRLPKQIGRVRQSHRELVRV
jgi:hypothetical protein